MEKPFKPEQSINARVIGKSSPEHKKKVEDSLRNLLWSHLESLSAEDKKSMEQHEMKKTPEQIELIQYANKESSRLMKECGVDAYDIPIENIHIVPKGFFASKDPSDRRAGMTRGHKQAIVVEYNENNPFGFGSIVFHELIHLKGYYAFDVREGEIHKKTPLGPFVQTRSGLIVHAPISHEKGEHEHFRGLDEAIVAEAECQFSKKMLNHTMFENIKKDSMNPSDEDESVRVDIARKHNVPVDFIFGLRKTSPDNYKFEIGSYPQQRKVLRYLCEEIQKQFSETFTDTNMVYQVFLSAQFTGKLFPVARLVEHTFGEGSFRILGNMTDKEESALVHMETLKSLRSRYKKEKGV